MFGTDWTIQEVKWAASLSIVSEALGNAKPETEGLQKMQKMKKTQKMQKNAHTQNQDDDGEWNTLAPLDTCFLLRQMKLKKTFFFQVKVF